MFIGLPFGTSLTFLLSLLSAVLIVVAFHYLAAKSLYFACFYFYFAVSRAMTIAVLPLWFSLLVLPCCSSLLSAIFNSGRCFYCHAIFIAAVHICCDYRSPPFFWLSFFSLFSRRRAVPIVTVQLVANSHTVVLSKPTSYSPALCSLSP